MERITCVHTCDRCVHSVTMFYSPAAVDESPTNSSRHSIERCSQRRGIATVGTPTASATAVFMFLLAFTRRMCVQEHVNESHE